MRLEDIGRFLKCECIVTDLFGRSSEPAFAETGPILPGTFQLSDSIKMVHTYWDGLPS